MKLKTFNKRYSKIRLEERAEIKFCWIEVKEILTEQEQNWQKITDKMRKEMEE